MLTGQGSLTDAPDASVLVAAIGWVQGTLLGTLATVIAIVAVAAIGLMMLGGRIDIRRSATTLVGCFILFGAASIASGIRDAASLVSDDIRPPLREAPQPPPLPSPIEPKRPADPYAGAAVPRSR